MAPSERTSPARMTIGCESPSAPPITNARVLVPSVCQRRSRSAKAVLASVLPCSSSATTTASSGSAASKSSPSRALRSAGDRVPRSSTSLTAIEAPRRFTYSAWRSARGPALIRPTAAISSRTGGGSARGAAGVVELGAPHLLEVVEAAHVRPEQMHDDVPGVDQHPVALSHPFRARARAAALPQRGQHALGERRDLPLRSAGGDHHVVGDAGFAVEVDDDDVLCLAVVEGLLR